MSDLKTGRYAPVYYLMGEEAYYIDLIANYIIDNVLTEEEKDFNLTVSYGLDVDISNIINAAKRYPVMSKYQVVAVREAQNIKNIDSLAYYLKSPMRSTILVFCHKNGVLDRRKKIATEIAKAGILFESKKLKDTQLPAFINSFLKSKGLDIDPKAAAMVSDFVGSDLSRLTGELEKLIITQPKGQIRITPEQVECNIGISKDYNDFELRDALVTKDVLKANRIIKYFAENPTSNPIQRTLSLLFSYFSNLMVAHYSPNKSDEGIASWLGMRSPWLAKDYVTGIKRFTASKTLEIIREIRYTDAKSKGVGNSNSSVGNSDLLRELIFKILH